MNTIEVSDLKKSFTSKTGPLFRREKSKLNAVDGVSFAIREGEIFSLLGPNGAGKTTTIKILATLLIPSDGTARVAGYDVVKEDFLVRQVLTAVLPGERTLYWKLTVKENLLYFGSLYGLARREMLSRISFLLDELGIADKKDTLVEKLSTGQRQKTVLCRAMLPEPKVILLDEPTLGLDPVSAKNLRETIKTIQGIGTTILLTTHYMYEADELSDRVAIINDGKIVSLDTPEDLKKSLQFEKVFRLETSDWSDEISRDLVDSHEVSNVRFSRKNSHVEVELEIQSERLDLSQLSSFCSKRNVAVHQVSINEPSLEDVFIEKTGKSITEAEGSDEASLLA